jgi:O-antigen/teichoic acid export membrane protein
MKQNKYLGRIYGGFYVSLAFGIVMLIYIFVKGRTFIDKRYWKYSLLIALPLIPHNISGLVLAQFDRIIIGKYIGNSAAGIYSFAYNMGMILSVVWASLNKAWVPWFYEKMDSKSYEEIKEKYKYYLAFFSIITFILIYISPEIGKLMSSRSFWEGLRLVPIIMISYYFCFLYSLPANVEFYTKKTYYISAGTFAAGFVNIILNLLFIPRYGYSVGAWTTLISYVLLFIFHYIVSQKVFSTKLFEIKYFIYSISFIVCISLLFYVTMNFWLLRYIIVCFVVALVLTKLRKVSILFK